MTDVDLRLKLAQIDRVLAQHGQLLADADRKRQEIRFAPMSLVLSGLTASAAIFAAGAAFVSELRRSAPKGVDQTRMGLGARTPAIGGRFRGG